MAANRDPKPPIQTQQPSSVIIGNSSAAANHRPSQTATSTSHNRMPRPYYRKDDSHMTTAAVNSPFTCNSFLADPNTFHPRHYPLQKSAPLSSVSQYNGVMVKDTVGTLTVSADRLVFKPQNRLDKSRTFTWHLETLQMHQISARVDEWQLKLVTNHQNPTKNAILKFPNRNALERIHLQLTNKLHPMRKHRKLKETLLSTQRKLKEANKAIDELQDTNQTLLDACEKFAKKCKSLSIELLNQQKIQNASHITQDTLLEGQLASLQALVESLKNEKTAMEIEYEMDTQDWTYRLTNLERDMKEERAAMERMLDERQPLDEIQLEVSALTKQIAKERQFSQQLQGQLEKLEHQEKETEQMIWQVRRQRNNVFLELAQVKKERDRLSGDLLNLREETQLTIQPALDLVKEGNDEQAYDGEADDVWIWRSSSVTSELSIKREIRAGYHNPRSGSSPLMESAFQISNQHHGVSLLESIFPDLENNRSLYQDVSQISTVTAWDGRTSIDKGRILGWESAGGAAGVPTFTLHQGNKLETDLTCTRTGTGRDPIHDQLQATHFLPDSTPVGTTGSPHKTWDSCRWWEYVAIGAKEPRVRVVSNHGVNKDTPLLSPAFHM
jgi:TFIIH p62 subunit, N-terminal domain